MREWFKWLFRHETKSNTRKFLFPHKETGLVEALYRLPSFCSTYLQRSAIEAGGAFPWRFANCGKPVLYTHSDKWLKKSILMISFWYNVLVRLPNFNSWSKSVKSVPLIFYKCFWEMVSLQNFFVFFDDFVTLCSPSIF